jgi:hypothetical protein
MSVYPSLQAGAGVFLQVSLSITFFFKDLERK